MAVEAVVSVVIRNVTYFLIQESIFFTKAIDQVEKIRQDLRGMREFLTYAEEQQETNKEAKRWVKNYLKTLYEVEEIVEYYVLSLVRKKTGMGLFKNYGFYFHDWKACQNLRKKLRHVEEDIKKLKENVEDGSSKGISNGNYSPSLVNISHNENSFCQTKRISSSAYEEDDMGFVGFEDDEKALEEKLTSKDGKIIGVAGIQGSGKTTLVKRLCNRKSIKERFNCHVWLNVSEEHVYKDLLLRVWNQVNENRDTELTVLNEEQLKGKLIKFLHKKECLIVLDDARRQPDAWIHLIKTLQKKDGCKVVLVTRQNDIARYWDSFKQPLHPQPLNDKDSRKFLNRLCPQKDNLFSEQNSIGDQILQKCQGLPLNIVLLGGFLSTKKMSCEELTRLCSQPNWANMDLWSLSYSDLPANYKLCLLYLTLFPKEFDLSVRRILRLWLAEGFLQHPPRMGEESEDLAEQCFDELVKRNLVKVSKFRSDGGPRKCHLPGFLREHLSPKAQEINLYHIHHLSTEQRPQKPPNIEPSKKSMEQSINVRRMVEYADIKDYDSDSNVENLRSYLSFNFQRYDTPAKGVGNFLHKIIGNKGFGLLRVLDLEGVYKPILPTTLKPLLMLRYLGLRWTFLDSLPKSVGDLPYLETLDLKGTCINNLPHSVWKLKHLRHLNLPRVRLDMSIQQPSSKLLTLWGLLIDDERHIENGLNQYCDLRELGIFCQLDKFDKLLKWITKLTHLQSLSLTSRDKKGRPSGLTLQKLTELNKLSRLKLLGKLSNLPKDQFPPNLRVLTLSLSNLNEDPMRVLSQLQCLSVLRLLAQSYNGQTMQCPEDGFKNLRVLKMWMLDELEELTVKQGGMPTIKELNIRRCLKLKELPIDLLHRKTLEELILTSMPDEFVNNVRQNKSEKTSLQTNKFVFTPLPWEEDKELWEEDQELQD